MTFVSYAQNHEDVLLWRALGHIREGYYIDVGANHPVQNSITKAFYDAGWRGINIEPVTAYHTQYLEQRPNDVNLPTAVGSQSGSVTLYEVPSMAGWATTEASVAESHAANGYEVVSVNVPVRTLNSVCEEFKPIDIHFLKIDVEGAERDVLLGLDLSIWRPWAIVIESTWPNSRESNHDLWESLILQANYQLAYFDGLNRYYVASERLEILPALSVQPNVFDEFVSYRLASAERYVQAMHEHVRVNVAAREVELGKVIVAGEEALARNQLALEELKRDHQQEREASAVEFGVIIDKHMAHAARLEQQILELNMSIQAIKSSSSWRATKALRWVGHKIDNLRR